MADTAVRTDELRRMLIERRREMQQDIQSRIRDGRTDRPKEVRDDLEHSDADIEAFLKKNDIAFEKIADDKAFYDFAARALIDGKVCGWFRGRFEFGPRTRGKVAGPRLTGRQFLRHLLRSPVDEGVV